VPGTKWLKQRRQGWYAVQDAPCALGVALGKKRLIVSLGTRDLRVAQARRHDALAGFARQLAAVRRAKPSDPVLADALRWRHVLAEDDSAETRTEAALGYHRVEHQHGAAAAQAFAAVSLGRATPLLAHVDAWLAEGGAKGPLRPRTAGQYRADLERLGA
jgi:hypothetical protein